MTFPTKLLFCLLPVIGSELAAYWWMHPAAATTPSPVLNVRVPDGPAGWTLHSDLYREVVPSLHCSDGWIADVAEQDGPGMRVAFFKWDQAGTVNTLEAFKHMPDHCMGSIGMDLQQVHSRRIHRSPGGTLIFDSTLFRPHGGGQAVHVFKAVWVNGKEVANLRAGLLGGSNGNDLRQLRLAAAATRFKPAHTRVIMGAVAGMPSEDLAWHRFSTAVLNQLEWPLENASR